MSNAEPIKSQLPRHLAAEEARLNALPYADAMRAIGFELFFNGGGATAWRKAIWLDEYVLVSGCDGASAEFDDTALVGRHGELDFIESAECDPNADAIAQIVKDWEQ